MNKLKLLAIAPLLALAACAVGNKYDYTSSIAGLPVTGSGRLALEVVDVRPYVASHEKQPNFIGLQRGGFGNPFDVTTASGRPLADEMRDALSKALMGRGYTVVGVGEAAPRKLQLRVQEWKSDVMMRLEMKYDLVLGVFDAQGALLAKSATQGSDLEAGGFQSQNATTAARAFEAKVTELVRDPAVNKALSGP